MSKLIDPDPIIKKLADRCLEARGLECSVLGSVIDMLKDAPDESERGKVGREKEK